MRSVFKLSYRVNSGSALVLLVMIFVTVSMVGGQTRRPLTPEDIASLNRASDAQVSYDGRRVVYVLTRWDRERDRYNSDLWMVTEARENQQLTSHERRDDHPRWSADGSRIAFLSERGADGRAGAQIYLLGTRMGGEVVQLTRHPRPIERFEWSFDGRYIAFLAPAPRADPRPETKDLPHRAPIVVEGDDDPNQPSPNQLWIVEVATGKIEPLTTGKSHLVSFGWSSDLAEVVYAARPSSRLIDGPETELYRLTVGRRDASGTIRFSRQETATATRLTQGNGAELEPRFSPDGQWISYLAKGDGDPLVGPDRLHILPSGGGSPVIVAPGFEGYVRGYRWVYDNERIIVSAGVGVNQQLYSISRRARTAQALTRTDGVNSGFSITPDGQTIAFIHENPRVPTEVALLSARIMVPIFLTELNPVARELALGLVETVRWNSKDGTSIEGLIVYPVGFETGRRYPLITSLHGGPEGACTKGFEANWSTFPQIYAARGYAVFLPNFRGSSNYGAKFAQSNARLAGRIDVEDVLSGIDHLIKTGIADGTRLGVVGWSYGGYLSGLLIGQTNRFRVAAWGAGLANAESYWGTADILAQRERLHGGTPWEAAKLYEAMSPLRYFNKVRTPALIFHGEKDQRVPLGQSQESFRRLRRLGVNVQMIIYPEQGHALEVPSYQIDKIRRELEWIEQHLMN
jgi:dipeptidyl aminopeptidase/acylaminoacyl peptidase